MSPDLLSGLCPLKQSVRIVRRLLDRKHKLTASVGTSPKLLHFEAIHSGMEPHIGQPCFRQPSSDLAHAANDFR